MDRLDAMAEQLHRWIDRSQALFEEVPSLDPAQAEDVLAKKLTAAMQQEADAVGLVLDADDWKLLDMDIRLNAQGLVFAANRAASRP